MPDRIEVNGRWYVAEDAIAAPRAAPATEPYLPLKRLCEEYGIDPHRAYSAIAAGLLDAPLPNGLTRGRRCRRSEFARWVDEALLGKARRGD